MNEYGFPSTDIHNTAQSFGSSVTGFLHTTQTIGYVLAGIFLVWSVYCVIGIIRTRSLSLQKFDEHFVAQKKQITVNPRREHWKQVTKAITESNNSQLWRLAIIDADVMLEEAIDERFQIPGESFGDKLKQFDRSRSSWIDAAWDVHRLRNTLAHEGGRYPLNQREVVRAYKIFENLLTEFGYFATK